VHECRRAERSFAKQTDTLTDTQLNDVEPWAVRMYDFFCVYHDQLVDAFQRLDVDQSGTLATDDFVEALHNLYTNLPASVDLKRTLAAHVREGAVNYREFLSGCKFINKKYLMASYEDKKKKKKTGGEKGGGRQRGNTKLIMPICMQHEATRVADGGPPSVYIEKKVHVTDLMRFSRDSRPRHPIEDDSGWYLAAAERSRVHFHDLVRDGDVNSLCTAFGIVQEQAGSVRRLSPTVTGDNRHHPELVDRFYKTPLMVACSSGDLQLVKLLVRGG